MKKLMLILLLCVASISVAVAYKKLQKPVVMPHAASKSVHAPQPVAAEKKLQKLTVILDWFTNPDHAPLYVAKQQGYFKQQGLDLKIISPANPADAPKLVAAGKAEIAITYQPQFMLQVARGWPLVRIGTLIATPLDCVAVLRKGPIKSLQDLRGKTIGYAATGMSNAVLQTMLAQHGVALKEVKLINVGFDLTQALLAKKVDAITGVMRNFEVIQMRLTGNPALVFYPEENGVPVYDELILVTNKKLLKDPRIGKFLKALDQGVQYLINHPNQSWQQFAKQFPVLNNKLNHQAWLASLSRFALRPAALDHSRYKNFATFMQQQGLLKTLPPLAKYTVEVHH